MGDGWRAVERWVCRCVPVPIAVAVAVVLSMATAVVLLQGSVFTLHSSGAQSASRSQPTAPNRSRRGRRSLCARGVPGQRSVFGAWSERRTSFLQSRGWWRSVAREGGVGAEGGDVRLQRCETGWVAAVVV